MTTRLQYLPGPGKRLLKVVPLVLDFTSLLTPLQMRLCANVSFFFFPIICTKQMWLDFLFGGS